MKLGFLFLYCFAWTFPVYGKSLKEDFFQSLSQGDEVRVAEILVKKPSLARAKYRGTPALFYAGGHPGTNLSALLIQSGAKVNVRIKNGLTPLLWALINENEELVRLLLEKGSKPNIVDKDKVGALSYAIKTGKHSLISLMMRYRLDPFTPDKFGKVPLTYARELGDPIVLKMVDEYQKVRKIYPQ